AFHHTAAPRPKASPVPTATGTTEFGRVRGRAPATHWLTVATSASLPPSRLRGRDTPVRILRFSTVALSATSTVSGSLRAAAPWARQCPGPVPGAPRPGPTLPVPGTSAPGSPAPA